MKNKCHAFKLVLCLLSWRKRTEIKNGQFIERGNNNNKSAARRSNFPLGGVNVISLVIFNCLQFVEGTRLTFFLNVFHDLRPCHVSGCPKKILPRWIFSYILWFNQAINKARYGQTQGLLSHCVFVVKIHGFRCEQMQSRQQNSFRVCSRDCIPE